MSTPRTATSQRAGHQAGTKPYRPSWVDSLTDSVGRLPGKSWHYYLALGLGLFACQSAVLWLEGVDAIGRFLPVFAFIAGTVSFFLALFNYLDARAAAALKAMRPALNTSEETFNQLHFQLTTLPRRPTWAAGAIIVLIVAASELLGGAFYPVNLAAYPISTNLFRVFYYLLWWFLGTYLYHTWHQLRLIDHIYTNHTHINLFRAKPFYAFSVLSALTSGSLGAIIYGWLLVNPTMPLDDPIVLVWLIFILLSALVAFVWPQLGMHRLQVLEQESLLDEAYLRLEAVLQELHRQLDRGQYGEIGNLNTAIASLEAEVKTIKGVRTWPWEPETLRLLVTALAMPLGVWLIQMILERLFS